MIIAVKVILLQFTLLILFSLYPSKMTADVFYPGTSLSGIKETTDEDQAATLPFAARYIKCEEKSKGVCDANEQKFRTQCWIDRDDVTPPTTQKAQPDNQDESHPGFRMHQLKSRSMAMTILTALENAIDTWSEITIVGKKIESLHVNYYLSIISFSLNMYRFRRGSPIGR
jgi:hypothetical protein